jgi:S-DNA-T family DNA segregation ATPase FtsK/SpoIIIE
VRILTLKPVKSTQQSLPEVETEPIEPGEFRLPPTTLLAEPPPPPPRVESELRANIEIIEQKLAEFKVDANVVEIAHGPTVARYEIRLAPGIKVNKIVGLADDLAMALAAIDVRLEAPIPGKAAIGVEVPNKAKAVVGLREIVESKPFRESSSKLTFALGKDVSGKPIVADLAKMPHLLIGGSTNSGKSVCLNSLIASLLYRVTPDECKLVLIDPKRVELSMFDGIPHLTCPVVKSAKQAAGIFRAVVQEMEHRYDILGQCGVRNIDGYNEKMGASGERMPYMVVVVDELCDLMMQAAAEVEGSITRIAQLARAVGIHLVIATQRPSVDVITGVIKANISSRIAFAVSSHHDSPERYSTRKARRG